MADMTTSIPVRTARRARTRGVSVALLVAAALAAGACAADEPEPNGPGIANPASENCIALGGTLEIEDGPGGQVGWCTLPDGRRVEEWELWRETDGEDGGADGDASDGSDDGAAEGEDLAAARADLEAAQARWEAAGIRRYRMTQRPVCFCPAMVHDATVEDGRIVALTTTDEAGGTPEFVVEPLTVEALFVRLEAAVDEGVAEVRVTYDLETGAPLEVWVDVDRMMADEEWGVSITAFERLG